MEAFLLIKLLIMAGLSTWLTIACLNNIVDQKTNRYLIRNMVEMSLLKSDADLGQGLLSRAWQPSSLVNYLLWAIIFAQMLIASLLWMGVFQLLLCKLGITEFTLKKAITFANYGLFAFMLLWLCFLCGGLWFGYWIKMGKVQVVHMQLLIISLLAIIVVNLPVL